MKIRKIALKNFRGYKSLELKFDNSFNLIIGNNGSGKTALLEAITVAIGSFFLGIRNVDSRGVHNEDIHISTFEEHEEYLFPVEIKAEGIVAGEKISWSRELSGIKNRTTTTKAKNIINIAKK
jgi:recombinational DNA repair ATPase RecF